VFRANSKGTAGGEGVTQFGRALLALNSDIICANSPQAIGAQFDRSESPTGQLVCHLYFARRVTFLSCADTVIAHIWLWKNHATAE
jgi:hypothetical protein